ncbi:MAG: hypothetical protein ACKVOU_04900 [Cytophagales bacterium]
MQKFLLYFSLFMALVYMACGVYFLLGSYLGWTPIPFQYQSIIGGLLAGYGSFRVVRSVNQIRANTSTV